MIDLEARPHALYRFFDGDDRLLYVGITFDLPARLGAHRDGKPWWSDVARVAVEHHPSRSAVLAAELAAIRAERPLYNVVHNRGMAGARPRPVGAPEPATAWYPDLVRSFDHSDIVRLESYPSLRLALSDFANEASEMSLAEGLAAIREMALTAPYADMCSEVRAGAPPGCGALLWPYAVERCGAWLQAAYYCAACRRQWTCGWSVSPTDLR